MKTIVHERWVLKRPDFNCIFLEQMFFSKSDANKHIDDLVFANKYKPVKVYIFESDPRKAK